MASPMERQRNPSIDGQQFVLHADTESTTTTSSTSSTTSLEDEHDEELQYGNDLYNQELNNTTTSNNVENSLQNANTNNSFKKKHNKSSELSFSEGGLLPNNFNAIEYLINSLYNSLDSIELDRALVIQSQLSGKFNNTSNEILNLIDEIKDNLNEQIQKYENLKKNIIPEIVSNINKSTKLSRKLTFSMKQMYPVEYSKSKDKVLNRITNEDEDLYI